MCSSEPTGILFGVAGFSEFYGNSGNPEMFIFAGFWFRLSLAKARILELWGSFFGSKVEGTDHAIAARDGHRALAYQALNLKPQVKRFWDS